MQEKQGFQKYKKLLILIGLLVLCGVCYVFVLRIERQVILSSYKDVDSSAASLVNLENDRIALTVPKEYVYGATQEQLNESAKAAEYESITLNEDGSATYIMTSARYDQMLADLDKGSRESVAQFIGSKDFSDIKSIEISEDFTEYTVNLSTNGYNFKSEELINHFKSYTNMLYIFKCRTYETMIVNIYDINGATVKSYSSADAETK